MKKLILVGALALPLLAGNVYAQSKTGFTLTGELANLENGKTVFLLSRNMTTGKSDTLAKAVSAAAKFTLKGSVASPDLYFLGIQDTRGGVPVFLENNALTLKGDVKDLKNAVITGSKSQDDYTAYGKEVKGISEKQAALETEYVQARKDGDKAKMEEIGNKYDALDAEKGKVTEAFASSHTQSVVAPFLLLQNVNDDNAAAFGAIYDKFAANVKATSSGKALKGRLELMAKTAVGQQAPLFAGKTPEGTELSLKQVLSSGKYTMIDFWASWCGPCRAENPNVVKLYEKYHAKGFNILGVSLDRDGEKWKKAIADDKLTWGHISDLKYWQSEYAAMYGVQGIPATFLLDANGKIVGKNLRGEELAKKLEELLGAM
ncbi:TlpA disulfide reductase family protein [Solitalea canadensis]|uniref:Thiol-disulfide isomerase-like thioredoxin n=1 Tax=Solitalea canadensis (strain ATCC 29591 / DSM 3403 / JCM 21819 / LMG 8368 / NBRC 15130 / NCIMB 12057 / USAM 9D) TaxID=929556 RepID=H8KQ59_SOLCM|nr:TlpA disulfide reductase family protein [Solitalea canadensis]AFD06227.1 thiol-disulfide isomerase-like thioredoxin [Solitalea canadensis DSM 3403]